MNIDQLKQDCKERGLTISGRAFQFWVVSINNWGSESDLKVRLQLDDAAREEMEENNSQTKVEIQQSTQMKTAERLRFEQHTKHLLEVANLPADGGQVNISGSKFAHLADGKNFKCLKRRFKK